MKNENTLSVPLLLLFLLVPFSSIFIAFYFPLNEALSLGVTADLVLTFPLLYLALIRNVKIPKTTAVPVLFIGVLIGSFVLPEEQQSYLNILKMYILPLLELFLVSYVLLGIYKMSKTFKKGEGIDFYTNLLSMTKKLFPEKISYFMASELSILYYCFFCWKAPTLSNNEFSYYKRSGTIALLWALMMIILVEAVALHFIINLWSSTFAWILTILSIYSCFQVLSLIRSIPQRPIKITNKELLLKYGTLRETTIPLEIIDQVMDYDRTKHKEDILHFSPLGELETPNLYIEFKEPISIQTMLGKKEGIMNLLLFVDKKETFQKHLTKG